jgi:curved DNA-binding protein CbpA
MNVFISERGGDIAGWAFFEETNKIIRDRSMPIYIFPNLFNTFYRDSNNEISLRNEEINRQRLQSGRASAGGPLKVTDPAAFAALMADMKVKAEQQKKLEDDREAERAKREGASYKTPEERAKESKDSKAQFRSGELLEEARSISDEGKFDPKKDYYGILGVDRAASAAEIRQKYKRLALLYHPDKHKSETPEEQAAVAAAFRSVAAAFDILLDEEQRALYDKCRDYMDANPGKGLPPLSPEEAAKMASGAAELRKLRRMGPKLAKHSPKLCDVEISLPKLNFGCTRSVSVERRRVDYSGKEHLSTKIFHLVIRKGSRECDKIVFPDEGDETVDTHPGDLIFTLRAKPHPVFRRKGEKDLEIFAAAVPAEDIVYTAEIETLSGGKRVVLVPALRAALENGGMGGIWHVVLPKLGLFDGIEPFDAPLGDLHVQIRYPAVILKEKSITSKLHPGPVYLLGSSEEVVTASLVAGIVASRLKHMLEALEMMNDGYKNLQSGRVVCLNFEICNSDGGDNNNQSELHAASKAILAVLRRYVPGITSTTATTSVTICDGDDGTSSFFKSIEDTAWAALHAADIIILDLNLPTTNASFSPEKQAKYKEECLAFAHGWLEDIGVLQAGWERHWSGVPIIAIGDGCSLLGRGRKERKYHTVLPWYAVRAGGSRAAGWQNVCLAADGCKSTAVGVLETSAYVVDSVTGVAELVVAPCKEALVAMAGWQGSQAAAAAVEGVEEAQDDFGYFAAFSSAMND